MQINASFGLVVYFNVEPKNIEDRGLEDEEKGTKDTDKVISLRTTIFVCNDMVGRSEKIHHAPNVYVHFHRPVCIILCQHRVDACLNPLPHTRHTNSQAPVCTGMCLVRLLCALNIISHSGQG